MQNLPHRCTADFERRKEQSVYYKFRRNLFKHGISFDVARLWLLVRDRKINSAVKFPCH